MSNPLALSLSYVPSARIPRRLDNRKCKYCRREKVKCLPVARKWPSEKCQRCEKNGRDCSAPLTKKDEMRANSCSIDSKRARARHDEVLAVPSIVTRDSNEHEQRAFLALLREDFAVLRSHLDAYMSDVVVERETACEARLRLLSSEALYRCSFWHQHLCLAQKLVDKEFLKKVIQPFIQKGMIAWLEVMCSLGKLQDAILALLLLDETIHRLRIDDDPILMKGVRAMIFVVILQRTSFQKEPRKIYHLALLTHGSENARHYWTHLVALKSDVQNIVSSCWHDMSSNGRDEKLDNAITAMALSPGDCFLACARMDRSIQIWMGGGVERKWTPCRSLEVPEEIAVDLNFRFVGDRRLLHAISTGGIVYSWNLDAVDSLDALSSREAAWPVDGRHLNRRLLCKPIVEGYTTNNNIILSSDGTEMIYGFWGGNIHTILLRSPSGAKSRNKERPAGAEKDGPEIATGTPSVR